MTLPEKSVSSELVDRCRELARSVDPRAEVITVSGNVLEYDDPIVGRVRLTFEAVER